jgi:hypothetical protein
MARKPPVYQVLSTIALSSHKTQPEPGLDYNPVPEHQACFIKWNSGMWSKKSQARTLFSDMQESDDTKFAWILNIMFSFPLPRSDFLPEKEYMNENIKADECSIQLPNLETSFKAFMWSSKINHRCPYVTLTTRIPFRAHEVQRNLKNIAITILDIIHRPVFYLEHDISGAGFYLSLQVEPTQLGP